MTGTIGKKVPSIDIVGASAGTGKTTRLATEFIRAVEGSSATAPIDPTRIIVCTFTNKAADELSARIRQKLMESGNVDAAQLVLAGYVGTVNAICGRLLKDYAFECGLSPKQNVIPEHMQNSLFSIASARVLDAYAQRIEDIAVRLSFGGNFGKSRYQKRAHWMDHVRTICSLARANGMTPDSLRESAKRSWQGMQRHLGRVEAIDPEELDLLLESELKHVVERIDVSNDSTKATADALQTLRECFARSRSDSLTWRDWAAMKKLETGKNSKDLVKDLINVCSILQHHPRLHADLREYIEYVFECAAESLEAYQQYKISNGLVDFVDQEYLALQLLDNPKVRASLSSRLDLLMIDEFQDTSPIQLALFLKLAELVDHSIWVGDVKQAIYGFRGTDPQLMQEAANLFNRQPPLEESYRSRPELVRFSNEVFRRVFPNYGISESDVVIRPSGKRSVADQHSLELWRCEGKDLKACFSSVASAVRELVQADPPAQIEDPHTGERRKLRGSDVAILCRKNDHCSDLAEAIANQGLKVAMTRDGLLDTAECLLTISTLRYLVDPTDKLALGRIVLLTQNYAVDDQSAWLTRWLAAGWKPEQTIPADRKQTFDEARAELARCTISDALNVSIHAGGILEMVEGWGDPSQRLSNLDALRGLVTEYEDICAMARTAATINGFLNYLEQLEESDQPASVDVDAVQILTYHGSKGLEWPVVILADLDAEAAPKVHKDLCKIYVEASDTSFDMDDPLLGRWIRFWPWPFGAIEKDGYFEASAANSPEYRATVLRARAENTRLMYVGVTRARDLLVMAPYTGRTKNVEGTQWLDELTCDEQPVIQLPESEDDKLIFVGDTKHDVRVRCITCTDDDVRMQNRSAVYSPQKSDKRSTKPASPYLVRPSTLSNQGSDAPITTTVIDIGERISIDGKVDMTQLGECVHSFLAVDETAMDSAERLSIAERICKLWQIDQISTESLLTMSERLDAFLSSEFREHRRFTECPVTARLQMQRLRGTIDLLIETTTAFHIIDHKTFPGSVDQWTNKALGFAPQLHAYRRAMQQAADKPVERLFIHMPIVGKIVELNLPEPI